MKNSKRLPSSFLQSAIALDGINEELADISMSSKMLIIFKLIELRPEMKEKLGPLINDLTELMDFDLGEG